MHTGPIVMDPRDDVATALAEIPAGATVLVAGETGDVRLVVLERIPMGHKVSLRRIPAGGPVLKYGAVIGRATADIEAGQHVHVHNLESLRGRGDLSCGPGGTEGAPWNG